MNRSPTDLTELYRLSFRELKAAASLPIGPSKHHAANARLLKDLCPHFILEDKVGLCMKLDAVCCTWDCEYLDRCRKKCVDGCLVLNESTKLYYASPPEVSIAMERLEKEIDNIADTLPPEVVAAGLSHIAEEGLLLAITESPMELFSALRLRKWLYGKYRALSSFRLCPELFKPFDNQIGAIWRHFLALMQLERDWVKVDSSDAVMLMSPEGDQLLRSIPEDPIAFARLSEEGIEQIKVAKALPPVNHLQCSLWTRRMIPVLRWCSSNMMPIDLHSTSLVEQRKAIYDHMVAVGEKLAIKPAECLRLGLPMYTALFHVIRYAALTDYFFAEVIAEYQGVHEIIKRAYPINLSPFFWDHTVCDLTFYPQHKSTTIPTLGLKGKQSEKWPIDDGQYALRGSTIVLAFTSMNYADVTAKNDKVGFYFEEIISKELDDRKIPIVARNLPVPGGEIDIVCFDSLWYYIIEAKDYGPRGTTGYFSSQDYQKRNEELISYLKKFEERLQWAKGHKAQIGVPENVQLVGLFLTSFEEPHIEAPEGILIVNHRRLCGLFGGAPVDPLLKYHDIELKPSLLKKEKREVTPQVRVSKGALPREQSRFVFRQIESKFGTVQAFQLYRIAWEVSEAIANKGFSVMELCAKPHGRPEELTKQYVFFVGYRADRISYEDLVTAYEVLIHKGLIHEEKGYIKIVQPIKTEYWHFSGKKWRLGEPETANLILYSKMKKDMNGKGLLFGFLDAMIGKPSTLTLVKSM